MTDLLSFIKNLFIKPLEKKEELSRKIEPPFSIVKATFKLLQGYEEADGEDRRYQNEREFHTGVYNWIRSQLGNNRVKHEVRYGFHRFDLVIDDKAIIELKIASSFNLKYLTGQIYWYKKIYWDVGVLILDDGSMDREEIEMYVDEFWRMGVKVMVIKGRVSKND